MTVGRETLEVKRETWARRSSLCILACCLTGLTLPAQESHAFKITEPAEGATLTAGSTVTAQVDAGKDRGIVTVRYYWYSGQDEALVEPALRERRVRRHRAMMAAEVVVQAVGGGAAAGGSKERGEHGQEHGC